MAKDSLDSARYGAASSGSMSTLSQQTTTDVIQHAQHESQNNDGGGGGVMVNRGMSVEGDLNKGEMTAGKTKKNTC